MAETHGGSQGFLLLLAAVHTEGVWILCPRGALRSCLEPPISFLPWSPSPASVISFTPRASLCQDSNAAAALTVPSRRHPTGTPPKALPPGDSHPTHPPLSDLLVTSGSPEKEQLGVSRGAEPNKVTLKPCWGRDAQSRLLQELARAGFCPLPSRAP